MSNVLQSGEEAKWVGASNSVSLVSCWVDDDGAHIGLYRDQRASAPCDVAISANVDGSVTLQVMADGKPVVVDLRKAVQALAALK